MNKSIIEIYPDLRGDTLEELFKKRDAIQILINCGYRLQPELDRVNSKITKKSIEREGQ